MKNINLAAMLRLQMGLGKTPITLTNGDKTFKGYLTRRTRPFNDVWLSGVLIDEGRKCGLTIENANKHGWEIV